MFQLLKQNDLMLGVTQTANFQICKTRINKNLDFKSICFTCLFS